MAPIPPPFDALGPEDWAAVWRAARRAQRAFAADGGSHGGSQSSQGATETVMLGSMSGGAHAEVGADVRGAWVELHRHRLREAHWPPMADPRAHHNQRHRHNPAPAKGHRTQRTELGRNTTMATTRRKSRKPSRRVKRANPKARSSRRNPSARSCTSSGRRLRSTRAARAGRGLARCRWDATRTNPSATHSNPEARVVSDRRGKSGMFNFHRLLVEVGGRDFAVRTDGALNIESVDGFERASPEDRADILRVVRGYAAHWRRGGRAPWPKARPASRSNPGFAAGTPVWARINGRLYKATVLSTFGARARVAVIDPYSGRESIRETAVSHLQVR